MLKSPMTSNAVLLAGFALVTALLLAGTHIGTREQIALAERQAAEKALLEIIPQHRHSNDLLVDTLPVPTDFWQALGLTNGGEIHVARQNGNVEAMIVPAVAPDGYSGDIRLIVGINRDGTIAGVRVLDHRETPGLGDKIDLKKSDWILSFKGKSLGNPEPELWRVKKDGGEFDQFTGATITPRAVVRQVKETLDYFKQDRARLLKQAVQTDKLEHQRATPETAPSEPQKNAEDKS
ncbi:MAG TPA: electron transport complex subunit RsxG [Porticoccaceae bacterium]|nr:electron transport complex subunit RsxG [Porticoccaceae bacterium]